MKYVCNYFSIALKTHHDQGNLKRKHLIGSMVTVSEGVSMSILGGGRMVTCWQHDTGAVTESLYFICKLDAENTKDWGWHGLLKYQGPLPVTHTRQQGHTD